MPFCSGHEGDVPCVLLLARYSLDLVCSAVRDICYCYIGALIFPLHCINSLLSGLCCLLYLPACNERDCTAFPEIPHPSYRVLSAARSSFIRGASRAGGNVCCQGNFSSDHSGYHCSDTAMGELELKNS